MYDREGCSVRGYSAAEHRHVLQMMCSSVLTNVGAGGCF